MLEAYSKTKWTSTRPYPTTDAPFAGLGAEEPSGAFAGAKQGVVLVLLGLGAIALWNGLKQTSRPQGW